MSSTDVRELEADARRTREAQQEAQRAATGDALYPGEVVEPDEGRAPNPASILDPGDPKDRLVPDRGDGKVVTRHPVFDAGGEPRTPAAAPPGHLVLDDRSGPGGAPASQ
jgi:hypothetical protein